MCFQNTLHSHLRLERLFTNKDEASRALGKSPRARPLPALARATATFQIERRRKKSQAFDKPSRFGLCTIAFSIKRLGFLKKNVFSNNAQRTALQKKGQRRASRSSGGDFQTQTLFQFQKSTTNSIGPGGARRAREDHLQLVVIAYRCIHPEKVP